MDRERNQQITRALAIAENNMQMAQTTMQSMLDIIRDTNTQVPGRMLNILHSGAHSIGLEVNGYVIDPASFFSNGKSFCTCDKGQMLQTYNYELSNQSTVTEFILSGISPYPNLQIPLFVICLIVYIITMLFNLAIVLLISVTPGLKKPMYFFLINLSLIDIVYSSNITPNTLANLVSEIRSISLIGCATQMYFFIALGSSEGTLLAVMAYDRYVAICKPLYYSLVINTKTCLQLLCITYITGFVNSFIHTFAAFRLSFCSLNHINHFYCDINPILALSCTDTYFNELFLFIFAGFIEVGSLLSIVVSYVFILFALFRITSTEGRHKSFSTCASHFTCVAVFYCPILFMYLRPSSSYSLNQDWVLSVFYTIIIPMLNPIIYSLRNQEMKKALQKLKYLCP
ncbi:olfactory receptor 1019-like [Bombina bombina]|uniref:olfactory receptor 1019-like n=1 Tax=Bombina bombina TaxID=8345 RepID=UPI00235A4B93|nr:olfactory receptor 1019-like [Bombina bombina]